MAAADSTGPGGSDPGYQLPRRPRLTAEEERTLSWQIQRGIDGLVAQFELGVRRLIDGFDPRPFEPSKLVAATYAGLRKTIVAHLVHQDGGPGAFREAAIDNVRKSVADFIDDRQRDGGAVQNAAQWVAERFTDAAFETHLPASTDIGDILTQGQRKLSEPLKDMVEANMRLAVAVARRYLGRCRDLELADLCQEGFLAGAPGRGAL